MASNLRVDTILPSTGTSLGIGTASGTTTVTNNLSVTGTINAASATITGNLGIGGTLTYEDVTNIDSVGIITARNGIYLDKFIFHSGDLNTSFGFPNDATDTFVVNTNSTEKLRIKSDGDLLTQGLTSPSFDNQGTNGTKYEFTGEGTAGKFPVINISGNSNTDGGTIGVLRFVNRENANSSSGGNNQSRGLVELDVRSTTSDSNAGDDSGGYMRFITKSEEGQLGERFVLTARGSFKSNGRHNLGGIREITSGTLANGESVSWNGSGTTYTNGALNWNSIGGNGGAWIGSLSVLSADQAPSGAMVLVGCHGSGFNNYNMLVNNFDGGISVTPTGTGANNNFWNSVITNSSGETIYYRMLVYHLGASTETIFGL